MRSSIFAFVFAGAATAVSGCVQYTPQESVVGDYLSGRLAARENEVGAAAEAFSKAQTEAPQASQILRDAFFFQLAAGRVEEAAGLAETLVQDEASGDDGLARTVLSARAIKAQDYAAAREYLKNGVAAKYLVPAVKILDAWALAGLDGPDAAYEALDAADNDAFRGFNPLHQALFAEKAGRDDDARAAHQLSVMTFGGPVGRSAYGAYLERAGDATAAREYYDLLAQNPGPERQAARQGLARIEAGQSNVAFADTTPAEGAAIVFYSLGTAILEQAANQRDAAERAGFNVGTANYNLPLVLTQLALYLDPSLDDAIRFAGSILNIYRDHDAAIEMLSRIPQSSPYYEQAQIDIANGLAAQNRDEEALAVLRATVRRDGLAAEARLALANLLSANERYSDAILVLNELIEQLPDDPGDDVWRYYLSRAAALLEINEWPRAEADLRRAVEIAPEQPTALNYLGYSWAERGVYLDEAFELIEKAVSLQPDSGAIIDSLGWARYQLGDYEEAVGHLEQAASIEPGDPTITDHLGDVYWRLGRKIEARYQWRRVLELNPGVKLETAVKTKLAEGLPTADDTE